MGWEDSLEKEMATYSIIFAGKSHGQRSLAGYSPWDCKESDTTELLDDNNMYTVKIRRKLISDLIRNCEVL